ALGSHWHHFFRFVCSRMLFSGAVSQPGRPDFSEPAAGHSLSWAVRRFLRYPLSSMTRRRWIADRVEGDRAYLLEHNANHLFRVLRVKAGQEFEVVAGGVLRLGTVVFASESQVEFHLGPAIESATLPEVTVFLSIFKFDRMEWALEKLAELGVARVVPVIALRSGHHLVKAAPTR